MSEFVNTVDIIGDDAVCDGLITRTLTEYADDSITIIGDYSFYNCTKLTKLDLPKTTDIGAFSFYGCSAMQFVHLPLATTIDNYAFYTNGMLTSVNIPSATKLGKMVFRNCSRLPKIDLPMVTSIDTYVFYSCTALHAVILRSKTVCELANVNAFGSMPISDGTGYVYVPASLVDVYRDATNWSAFANQIRAIEDYPEITGG